MGKRRGRCGKSRRKGTEGKHWVPRCRSEGRPRLQGLLGSGNVTCRPQHSRKSPRTSRGHRVGEGGLSRKRPMGKRLCPYRPQAKAGHAGKRAPPRATTSRKDQGTRKGSALRLEAGSSQLWRQACAFPRSRSEPLLPSFNMDHECRLPGAARTVRALQQLGEEPGLATVHGGQDR